MDKYSWVDIGSSFLPSDILSAILFAQLERHDQIQQARQAIWERYDAALSEWAAENGVKRPTVPPNCKQAYHLYYLLMPSLSERQRFIAYLRSADIYSVFHYLPLNRSEMARKLGVDRPCPVTEACSDRLVRLPFFTALQEREQEQVIERVASFRSAVSV